LAARVNSFQCSGCDSAVIVPSRKTLLARHANVQLIDQR